ncbi:MAG: PQQ-binding-like beta-propeller repeat protein [Theionarchaea archaeon]|nr:PQQ-binding-like beta-propeller repeat protein [Theionarchaea archaeon]
MTRKTIIYLVVCCLLCSSIRKGTDDWPMFQHDSQHTGYSTSEVPESLRLLWKFEGPRSFGTYLIISQGMVIAAYDSDLTLSLNIADGSPLWEVGEHPRQFPTADEERVYIGLFGEILCVNATRGEKLWQFQEEYVYFESPIVVDDNLITHCSVPLFIDGPLVPADVHEKNKKVLCLDVETGEVSWEFRTKDLTSTSPVYYDGGVYIHDGTSIYCVDVETGNLIWEKKTGIEGAVHLSLSQDGQKIFVASHGGVISCLERDGGKFLWQFDSGDVITNAVAVGYDSIFFGTAKGTFYCLDAKEGNLLWKREMRSPSSFCSPLMADKKVVIAAENVLYIVSARSGKTIESYETGDTITSTAISDGKLVVASRDGRILCLGSSQNFLYQVLIAPILTTVGIIVLLVFIWKK